MKPDLVSQVLPAHKGNRKLILRINTRRFNVTLDLGVSFLI